MKHCEPPVTILFVFWVFLYIAVAAVSYQGLNYLAKTSPGKVYYNAYTYGSGPVPPVIFAEAQFSKNI